MLNEKGQKKEKFTRNLFCCGPTCYPPLTGVSGPAPAVLAVVRTTVSEVSAGPVTVAGLAHLMLDHALARPAQSSSALD